jgi:hypothetical protein
MIIIVDLKLIIDERCSAALLILNGFLVSRYNCTIHGSRLFAYELYHGEIGEIGVGAILQPHTKITVIPKDDETTSVDIKNKPIGLLFHKPKLLINEKNKTAGLILEKAQLSTYGFDSYIIDSDTKRVDFYIEAVHVSSVFRDTELDIDIEIISGNP